ncbi:MAG: hypothetical protein RLZZ312_1150 [Bacteroidota bacterium]|jgi:BirA family biotin operon repressor/biotin-[acetyl-CoA-carboxylase] ligase
MKFIKIDAIDSTNRFLKDLAASNSADDFTVVFAKQQSAGRGQMGATWQSDADKNLIMSILILDSVVNIADSFLFNQMVSVSITEVLRTYEIPLLSIKWPNDIMSGNKKVGGILIENQIRGPQTNSVVGIGLNINQTNFENLPNASSLKNVCLKDFDTEKIGIRIAEKICENQKLFKRDSSIFNKKYLDDLFKKNIVMTFEKKNTECFRGKIVGISTIGLLTIELENGVIEFFCLKEIKMIF